MLYFCRMSTYKKVIILFILFSVVVAQVVNAQTPELNREKYDALRKRFNEKFIYAPGNAASQGTYIPVELRFLATDGAVVVYWADGTWWLGHYVAMLSLEYARLRAENLPADATLAELKQALLAYRRLDLNAELCWNGAAERNGFYLRDDVPADMAGLFGAKYVRGDYYAKCGDTTTLSNSPSQDQAWASYMGLALAKKLVDDAEVQHLVRETADMFLKSMQHTEGKKEVWEVVNPVTGAVAQKRADIQWLRHAHASAYEFLADTVVQFGHAHRSFWKSAWNFLQNNFMIDKHGHFNWYGVMVLSTVINEWGSGGKNIYDWLVGCGQKLSEKRPDLGQPVMFPHLPLVALLLHGYSGDKMLPRELYDEILNAAPIEGASLWRVDGELVGTPAPWCSMSLFCPWHTKSIGEYNMLDYMLLYNAYWLVYQNNGN